MLSIIAASAVKRFSATRSTARCEKHVEQQWHEHTRLPETLLYVDHVRAFAIIQPHACSHAVVELAGGGKHSRWYTKASQDRPQESAVGGVTRFAKVAIAQQQWSVLLPGQFHQASNHEQHVDR